MWKLWFSVVLISVYVNAQVEDYRLPRTILPVHYTLKFRPYLLESDGTKRFSFDAEATIEIEPQVRTNTIVMHSQNLIYNERTLWNVNDPDTKIQLSASNVNTVTDKVTYVLENYLEVGQKYILYFNYIGSMEDDNKSFYRSSYVDSEGQTKWIGSTQFQSVYARRAFPSFDEPGFKATFQLSIIRPKDMSTFSNTRYSTKAVNITGCELDEYLQTPKMSTYLVAFLISEFKVRGDSYYGVIARPELYDQTEYSYTFGQKSLKELENYFDIKYTSMGVDKMHMAAIPDFSAGAMENWGLITYRERTLLYSQQNTDLSSKQYIAQVVTHEQTHMWFGDLVTCGWWSYTWLNEGFARYFQYHATHNIEPILELDKQFVVAQVQVVMTLDASSTATPMSNSDTNTPADVTRMFNGISYSKGGTFVRSLKHILGETLLQKALREYIKERKYTNTIPQHLFNHLSEYWPAQHKGYDKIYFESFTEQPGFPVLNLKLADDGMSFTISQKRFLLGKGDASLLYTVPLSYTTNEKRNFVDTAPALFLAPTTATMIVELDSKAEWIIANIQEAFYYRVNYDTKTWHGIHAALTESNWGGIHELNRAQICNDLLNLARANEISYDLALEVLEYLSTETNYLPWTAVFNGFVYLRTRLGAETTDFARYIIRLTNTVYQTLGFEERTTDTPLQILARASVLSWACKYGNQDCITKALQLFRNVNSSAVPVNIRAPVYCTAMREGSEADFDVLYEKYKTETSPTEKIVLLNALGCVKNERLVRRFYNIILGETVRRQDRKNALSSLYSGSNENVMTVFELIIEDYKKLVEATNLSDAASIISTISSYFTEESQLKALQNFNELNSANFGIYASTLATAEITARVNLDWDAERLPVFKEYLKKDIKGSGALHTYNAVMLLLLPLIARLIH